jgi:hypothetical protein
MVEAIICTFLTDMRFSTHLASANLRRLIEEQSIGTPYLKAASHHRRVPWHQILVQSKPLSQSSPNSTLKSPYLRILHIPRPTLRIDIIL